MVFRYSIVIFLMVIIIASCAEITTDNDSNANSNNDRPEAISQPGELVVSKKTRDFTPTVDTVQFDQQIVNNTKFAFELYRQILKSSPDKNVFFSPHSIEVALAMAWAGAKGATASEIATALTFEFESSITHSLFNKLNLDLNRRGQASQDNNGPPFQLNIVNGLWGQAGFEVEAAFLDTLALNYGAGLNVIDFITDPVLATLAINRWVSGVTGTRIDDLIPLGVINPLTRLVLVNAIYFKATWATPFDETKTANQNFSFLDGTQQSLPFMYRDVATQYVQDEQYYAVILPYDKADIAMTLVLPRGNLSEFQGFTNSRYSTIVNDILDNQRTALIELTLPKWTIEGETVKLKPHLQSFGMKNAFEAKRADFSAMTTDADVFIADVVHQAFIRVNEVGTEAAAATGVVFSDTSAPLRGPKITFNRPFLFFIVDEISRQILFFGHVVTPLPR